MAGHGNDIYSATYSGVPVYEFNVGQHHVMRRRYDNYVNATHILKVADYDKPARTRILEREVQKGTHEKIQGGYGKYQGTWVPLEDARQLAARSKVYDRLQPLFDFVPTNVSPPPAPKHATNVNKPKVPKGQGTKKGPKPKDAPRYNPIMSDDIDMSSQILDEDSQDAETIDTASYMDGDDGYGTQYVPGSRKRKRAIQDQTDYAHMAFADALLDYFILSSSSSEGPGMGMATPPAFPPNYQVDRSIDTNGHTALHWAVSMGDLDITQMLVNRNANVGVRNHRGETSLIRAVVFTNNYEKQTLADLMRFLQSTLPIPDYYGANVLHHIAMTTGCQSKRKCALYYLEVILESFSTLCSSGAYPSHQFNFNSFINQQDRDGNTALHIAARNDAKNCIRLLQEFGAQGDIPNKKAQTADETLSTNRALRNNIISSSPPRPDIDQQQQQQINGIDGHITNSSRHSTTKTYRSESALSFSHQFDTLAHEKSLQLSLALDRVSQEKTDALQEAQDAVDRTDRELQATHQAALDLLAARDTTTTTASSSLPNSNESEETELARLRTDFAAETAAAEAFSEKYQHADLHSAIRRAETALPLSAHKNPTYQFNGDDGIEDQAIKRHIRAAYDLHAEQLKRRRLTQQVVQAQADAGMTPTGERLKGLVGKVMGVAVGEVPGLAGELLEELVGAGGEIDGVGGVGGGGGGGGGGMDGIEMGGEGGGGAVAVM